MNVMNDSAGSSERSTPSSNGKMPNVSALPPNRQRSNMHTPNRQNPRPNRSLLRRQKLSPDLLRKACMTEQNELLLNGKNEHLNSSPSLRPSPFQKACMTLQSERQKN